MPITTDLIPFSVMVSDGDANDSITINLTINPVDDPAIISGDFNQTIQEDNSASGTIIIASDIDGLTDGSYFAISTPLNDGISAIDPWMVTGHTSPTLTFGDDNFTISSPMTSISPPSKSSIFSFIP